MFYTYILRSKKDDGYYIGYTKDVRSRLERHNQGRERSTKNRIPFELVYIEEFESKKEAIRYERRLKSLKSKIAISKLINMSVRENKTGV